MRSRRRPGQAAVATTTVLLIGALAASGAGRGESPATRTPAVSVTPASLTLGPVLADSLARDTVVVRNNGTTLLTLGSIVTDDPAFAVGSQSGGIPPGTTIDPGANLRVEVSFRTASVGTTSATMTIPSDDPVQSEVLVPLDGIVIPPPVAQVSPDSLAQTLSPGQTATQQLTITNAGGSDLNWSVSIVPVAAKQRAAAPNLQGVSILWDRTHGQQSTTAWTTIVDSLVALGAAVTEVTGPAGSIDASVLGSYRAYWSIEVTQPWTSAERAALATWTSNGGGILVTGDNGTSTAQFDSLLAAVGSSIAYSAVPATPQTTTTSVHPHPVTAGVSSVYIGPLAKTLTVGLPAQALFDDQSGPPVGAAEQIGLGRLIVLADETFDDPAIQLAQSLGAGNQQLGMQGLEWLVGATWLTTPTPTGTIVPGGMQVVDLNFDATGLAVGGSFDVTVRISSNDPVTPAVDVPVHLVLTGAPDIAVSPASLDLGPVAVGSLGTDVLVVKNVGQDTLRVSGIASSSPYISAIAGAFQLLPAESSNVTVTFLPDSVGTFADTLVVASDDPDQPSLDVPVQGTGTVDCSAPCAAPFVTPANAQGSPGFDFPVDIEIDTNPSAISAFGFTLSYDGQLIQYADSLEAGTLTTGFVLSAQENQPGVLTCGGFGLTAVADSSVGSIVRLHFTVLCDTCAFGTTTDLVLGGFTNGLVGMNACCGTFTLTQCPTGSGDINTDGLITPQDALCALKVFTGGAPADSQCDGNGNCETEAADANCDSVVDPGDALLIYNAWVSGLSPTSCIGGGGAPRRVVPLRWGAPALGASGETVIPLLAPVAAPADFGLEITAEGWAWAGVEMGAAAGWKLLEGAERDGRVRIGGIDPEGAGAAGEIARLVFRPMEDDRGEIRVVREFGVGFEGPRGIGAGPAGTDVPVDGLERVGPVPARGSVEIGFGVARPATAVDLRILDVTGRTVRTLVAGALASGRHASSWDGRDESGRPAAAGIYFVRLRVEDRTWTRKAVLIR